MIGKPGWFIRRKYTGWGLTPVTWQGWIYIAAAVGLFVIIQELLNEPLLRVAATALLAIVFLADFLHIMASMKLDEREIKIEAIAERNASWTMVTTLALELVYLTATNLNVADHDIVWLLIAPLFTGLSAKALSNMYLQNKEI